MKTLNGNLYCEMLITAAYYLKENYKKIDDLNVFPVPDGDTGSNMLSTFLSGIKEIKDLKEEKITVICQKFSRGLLLGARGNSGVILSQIFAGLAKVESIFEEADVELCIKALEQSKISAYNSVPVPVEGTILTVISDATSLILKNKNKYNSIEELCNEYYTEARASLDRTPLLLPVLKEADVVDSGGAGFVTIIHGMKAYLEGEKHTIEELIAPQASDLKKSVNYLDFDYYELNKYGYCTEFTIRLNPNIEFNKESFTTKLEVYGYSIVVVNNDDIVKVHIHTKTPGDVFSFAQRYGALCAVKADNMAIQTKENSSLVAKKIISKKPIQKKKEKYGIVAVVNGDGLKQIFTDLGVNEIIEGGQTMNPSTEDFINAINKVNAEHVFVIPNNKNVYMSAKTAKALINDKHVIVIPAKTIAQGYAAMTVFDATEAPRAIVKDMETKIESIESGEVTYAIRNSVSSGIEIKKNDFIAILDGTIINSCPLRLDSVEDLIRSMIKDESSMATIFYGSDANEEYKQLEEKLTEEYPNIFFQFLEGDQNIYSYIIEVE